MKIDINHYKKIDNLICLKATGSPDELARVVGLSRRQTLQILKDMKEHFSAPIKYNSSRKSYIYTEDGYFALGFQHSKKEKITQAVLAALNDIL
jgi:hypothetical protein